MVETVETVRFAELTDNSRQYLKELDRVAQPLIRAGVYASEGGVSAGHCAAVGPASDRGLARGDSGLREKVYQLGEVL